MRSLASPMASFLAILCLPAAALAEEESPCLALAEFKCAIRAVENASGIDTVIWRHNSTGCSGFVRGSAVWSEVQLLQVQGAAKYSLSHMFMQHAPIDSGLWDGTTEFHKILESSLQKCGLSQY